MIGFKKLAQKFTNLLLAVFIITAQLYIPLSAIIPDASAVPVCVNDTAGVNDEPGQKDLTKLCVDYAGAPNTLATTWNWDETGTSGANTMDACNLFDTDGDGNINYAVCVTTTGDPASLQTLTTYSCGDTKIDRCTSPATPITSGATSCTISQQNTDPFPNGTSNPKDTQGSCTVQLSTVGGATARLIDVCSYPSAQPNSDPSDCVIIRDSAGKIEVIKDLTPSTDSGLFNLSIDGPQANDTTTVNNVGDNGTTGEVVVKDGTVTVGETAGTNTSLNSYSTTISCRDLNGTGTVVAQSSPTGSPRQLSFSLADQADVICTITNTASSSITIIKDAVPNDAQDFAFTTSGVGTSDFLLDDDANATLTNTKLFSNLGAGTYTFTEASVAGWYLDSIECPNITETKDLTTGNVSLTISAGQNITCTFTNRKLGQLLVTKQTNPNNDPQSFSITATGTNTISGSTSRDIIDDESETFIVRHGEYDVSEQDIAGWSEDDSACQNLVIDGNTPLVNGVPTRACTITNTKLATLQIIKDALPNHEQDFAFTTTGLGSVVFSLDDDADGTVSNQQMFANLIPNQQYSVTEQSTPGWSLTGLSCDTVAQQGNTATVTPRPGQTITCTFTNTKLISVSGTKFEVNAGATDGGLGTVLGGWTIFIDSNNNGTLDQDELSDETDQNGDYSFDNLLYGTTVVLREVLQAGWTQIFGPSGFTLDSASDVTDKDFGNFENGSISGFKWNDRNANDIVDLDEEKLNDWIVTLYNDGNDVDTELDDVVSSTQTAGAGAYSFTNLTPGTYAVCETQQAGWIQTYPNSNGCHTITINESGETNQANFGNQGRGTLTVIKNVDSDGNGSVDSENVTNWTWDIDGAGDHATGSGSPQAVAAGTYTVSEDQQADYHVTASSCTGETTPATVTISIGVTVTPGENVVCTFVNSRDTGNITVNKVVNPTTDTGLFNLQINGQTAGTGANVGNGGSTGSVQIVTGSYTIGETAGTNTNINNYTSSYSCVNQSQAVVASGSGTSSTSFEVNSTDNIVCTITNTRLGRIIVQKETNPNGSSESFEFDTSYDILNFYLSDGQSDDSGNLLPGTYSVSELAEDGWELDSVVCSDQSNPASIELGAGETVTCTFTNEQDANIVVVKQTNPDGDPQSFSFIASYIADGFNLSDGQSNDSGDLDPGTYSISENELAGWDLESAICSDESTPNSINLSAGETVTCTFTNEKDARIIVVKQTDPDGSEELFDFSASYDNDGFSLSDGQQNDSGDLDPGTYSISETTEEGWDLDSASCDDERNPSSIDLSAGETVTCTFTNIQRSNITVVKNAYPNDEQDFHFTIDELSMPFPENDRVALLSVLNGYHKEFDLDDDSDGEFADTELTNVRPGIYTITENQVDGWDLTEINCGDIQIINSNENSITFYVPAGLNIMCTFTNVKRAQVVVTKYNDHNQNGMQDLNEITLSDWEIILNDTKQLTGQAGTTAFTNLLPNEKYTVGETQQTGWIFTSISCSGNMGHAAVTSRDVANTNVFPAPGETVSCKIGNTKPAPAVLGDSTTAVLAATLVNTGQQDVWIGTLIGFSLMLFAVTTTAFPIKTKRSSSVISLSRLSR